MASSLRSLVVVGSLVAVFMLASQPLADASPKPSTLQPKGTFPEKVALLTSQELASVQGAPAGLKVVPGGHSISLYAPRGNEQKGPCGKYIKLSPKGKTVNFPVGAGEEFQATSLTGFQYIVDLPGQTATYFLTAWQRQNHPGCPAYQSTNPDGTVQTTKLLAALPLPRLVDQEAGSLSEVSAGSSSVGIYALAFRTGRRIDIVTFFVPSPVTPSFGEGLAQLAETRLNASEGAAA